MTDPHPPTASAPAEHTAPAEPTEALAPAEPAEDAAPAEPAERTVDTPAPAEDFATTDPTDDAADTEIASFVDSGVDEDNEDDAPTSSGAVAGADEPSAEPDPGSGTVPAEVLENYPPESGSEPPRTDLGDEAAGEVPGDEEHLAPGQTEVPVGDEVVIDDETMRRAIEAILMVTDEPLPVLTLARAVGRPTGDVAEALGTLADEYTEQGRGFDLREVGGGWRYYTRVDAAPYVERFVLDGQQARLTQAALETLAVVAYKQPVSRARVSAIRGVNVDGVMRTLIARGLVEEAGADTESQAILYRTTSYFLERMGMQSLDDLPELAPYLPDMDDIEDELAAQTIPSAAPDEAAPTEDTIPREPTAEAERADGASELDEAADAADEPSGDEPIDGAENSDADQYGEDGPTKVGGDESAEDATPSEPTAEADRADGENDLDEAAGAADEPTGDEPIDGAENLADQYGEDGPTKVGGDDPTEDDTTGDEPAEDATLSEPTAEAERADGANELDEPDEADEPAEGEAIDAAENSDADQYGEDGPTKVGGDDPTEDVPGEDETGVDGDLATGEPVELDVEHESGDFEPSEEIEPAESSADDLSVDEVEPAEVAEGAASEVSANEVSVDQVDRAGAAEGEADEVSPAEVDRAEVAEGEADEVGADEVDGAGVAEGEADGVSAAEVERAGVAGESVGGAGDGRGSVEGVGFSGVGDRWRDG